jgi:NTP pyrophosphatase (non-canonical NTP hydrolase)
MSLDSIFSEISRLNLKDGKTIEQRLLKLLEELGELSQALLSSKKVIGCEYKGITKNEVLEESVDVLICSISMLFESAIETDADINQINDLIITKIEKWKEKSNIH